MLQTQLDVSLMGTFEIRYGGIALEAFRGVRLQALLSYLLLANEAPVQRQYLAFQLWPDTQEASARNNLRQLLFQLRAALPEPERFLASAQGGVRWQHDPYQRIDVNQFREALHFARTAAEAGDLPTERMWLERAAAEYKGELLPGSYDEWIRPMREGLQQLAHGALRRLALLQEDAHAYGAAMSTAAALRRIDPVDEEAYIQEIRLSALMQNPAGARLVYQTAVDTFARELDSEPGEAITRAYGLSQRPRQAAARVSGDEGAAGALLPMVGRRDEWQALRSAWQRATAGHPTMVLITGEAGIGKSRLAEELYLWARQEGAATARTRSFAAEGTLSLGPVAEWLRAPDLRAGLLSLEAIWQSEAARLLPELLVENPALLRPEPIVEYGQRRRFFEALARAVYAVAGPLLLWIDDLQWCDVETIEWLHYLLRAEPQGALLLVGTARSEESPVDHPLAVFLRELRSEGKLISVDLASLDAAETARLVTQVEGREPEVESLVRLYRQTGGNPFFVVETLRAGPMGASDTDQQPHVHNGNMHLPPRVYAVIERRIAHLSALARKVADVSAAFGRAITWQILVAVLGDSAGESEEALATALDELVQKRIVREQGANTYDFTHDNLRDVTYALVSAPMRRLLHRRVAAALEGVHAGHLDPVSGQIAYHFEQAGAAAQAAPYFARAGHVAAAVYANEDAIALLNRSLAQLRALPQDSVRDVEEIKLQAALSALYRTTMGWTSPEVVEAVERTLALSRDMGDARQRAQALYGAQSVFVVAAQFDKVESNFAEMSRLFMENDGRVPPFAWLMYAGSRLHMGFVVEAHKLFDEILSDRDDRHVIDLQASQGVNYIVLGHAWDAHALWQLGQPAPALASAMNAVHIAQQFAQPFSQVLAATYLATLLEIQADFATFSAQAEEALRLALEHRVPYYGNWATILVHFARAWREPTDLNLKQLGDAIAHFVSTGARVRLPYFFSLHARAAAQAGRLDEGLASLEKALEAAQESKEQWWVPEIMRLRGENLAQHPKQSAAAAAAYRRALDLARDLQARSHELRAATSLARHWHAQGRTQAARALLQPLYDVYASDLMIPDLETARALLNEMK